MDDLREGFFNGALKREGFIFDISQQILGVNAFI